MVSHSRPQIRVPSLRRHKASGRAVVTIRGRDIYCGEYGSDAAVQTYRRVIAELVANGPEIIRHRGATQSGSHGRKNLAPATSLITVAELLLAYVDFAERFYLPPSRELEPIKVISKTVREQFGTMIAADFGPRCLKTLRQHWIDQGLARKFINAKIGRVVRIWGWAAEEELIPATAWHSLKAVRGLRAGRSEAKETPPKESVPEADFWSIVTGLSAPVRAIFELLWWTGARSGEILKLRTRDIIRDCEPWQYCPTQHKNAHRGHKRVIFFGPKARAILAPFLDDNNPEKFLFSPADAVEAQREAAKVPHRSDARRRRSADLKRRLEAEERLAK